MVRLIATREMLCSHLRRTIHNGDGEMTSFDKTGGPDDPASPVEGLRLIKAFSQVTNPAVRAAIIEFVEHMAAAGGSAGGTPPLAPRG
jgi:hypothetical protein